MEEKIAVFGGNFDPSGVHHQEIVIAVRSCGYEVIVVPCGTRPHPDRGAAGCRGVAARIFSGASKVDSEIDRNHQIVLAGWAGSAVRTTEAGGARDHDTLPAPGAGALQKVERVFLGPAAASRQETYPERPQSPRGMRGYQCDEGSGEQPHG